MKEQMEKEARDKAAKGPAVMWGNEGVTGMMNDDEYLVNQAAEPSPQASPEANANRRSKGVHSPVNSPVMLATGAKAPPPKSLGWGPTGDFTDLEQATAPGIAAPYPVDQDPKRAIALLKEALALERQRADDAEGQLKKVQAEKEGLQRLLRDSQDKMIEAMTGLQVS